MIHHPVDCPPGMRLMKPDEREATSSELERVRIKLLKALSQARIARPLENVASANTISKSKNSWPLTGFSPRASSPSCAILLPSRTRRAPSKRSSSRSAQRPQSHKLERNCPRLGQECLRTAGPDLSYQASSTALSLHPQPEVSLACVCMDAFSCECVRA